MCFVWTLSFFYPWSFAHSPIPRVSAAAGLRFWACSLSLSCSRGPRVLWCVPLFPCFLGPGLPLVLLETSNAGHMRAWARKSGCQGWVDRWLRKQVLLQLFRGLGQLGFRGYQYKNLGLVHTGCSTASARRSMYM